ncbi:MAG TPA: amidohydrolase [Eubacteriales bacterium]|nr:amidohydrolase [Eubacteriales bacterium]
MTGDLPEVAEAFVVSHGKIQAIGSQSELERRFRIRQRIDLGGKTVLPGLIDSHSHFTFQAIADALFVGLHSAPAGDVASITDVVRLLREHNEKKHLWAVIGHGFDDTKIEEYRFPTRDELDMVSMEKPVVVIHQSFHLMSLNSKALELSGITDGFIVPEGGTAYRDETGRFTGVLEEGPVINLAARAVILPLVAKNKLFRIIENGSLLYLSQGYTTANEGAAVKMQLTLFSIASLLGMLKTKMVVNLSLNSDGTLPITSRRQGKCCDIGKRVTIGPIKLFTDGSIQGYTAYLRQPYYRQHKTRKKSGGYRGYLSVQPEKYERTIERLHRENLQYAVHANGDAAIQLVIDAEQKYQRDTSPHNIIIHCQTAGIDQLEQIRDLGLIPSFFPVHTYVWGKHHRDTYLGQERAARMNPLASAQKMNIICTIHSDSPVTAVDPWLLLWSAVTRLDEDGEVLGPDERVSVYESLLALTRNAAAQYRLADRGALTEGKRADFIVLEQNPFSIGACNLKGIRVMRTYVNGKLVFLRE